MARNPYDRRGPRDPRDFRSMAGVGSMVSAEFSSTPPALVLDELIAIGRSAYSRGRRDESRDIDDRVRDAQREAWDQGCEAGIEDGRVDLLQQLDEQFGAALRAVTEGNAGLLMAFDQTPQKVTKAALANRLKDSMLVMRHLINKHHEGFPPGLVDFLLASTEVGVATEDADAGDIVTVDLAEE